MREHGTPGHGALSRRLSWSMMFSENRYPLFGIMLAATRPSVQLPTGIERKAGL
jgi:hypothetical protein